MGTQLVQNRIFVALDEAYDFGTKTGLIATDVGVNQRKHVF